MWVKIDEIHHMVFNRDDAADLADILNVKKIVPGTLVLLHDSESKFIDAVGWVNEE